MKTILQFRKVLITFILIYVCTAAITVKAQNTCATAVSFTPIDTFKEATYNITDSIYWLKFVATDTTIFLQIVKPNNTPQASINHIYLNRGICGRLTLLVTKGINDSLMIAYGPLTIGNTYYVKVNRTQTTSAYFGLSFQYRKVSTSLVCSPPSCNLIRNGLFEINNCPNNYNWSPFYPSWDPQYIPPPPPDTSDDVCGWMRAWGTPQLFPNTLAGNHYAKMWSRSNREGEGIMQTINIPTGTYTLNFSYQIQSYAMDSLIVCLTNTDFTEHTYINSGEYVPYSYWHPNMMDIIYSAANIPNSTTWHHISQQFMINSTYNRIVIYPSQTNNSQTWLYVDSVSIVPQSPPIPIIAGQWDLCHGTFPNNITTSDTIKNWNSGYTYHYYIGVNGIQQLISSNPFNVNWTGHTNGGMLYVMATDNITGCLSIDSFKVYACCGIATQGLNDITLSTPQTFYGSCPINGQVIIDANITFGGIGTSQRAHMLMGPNAKIIINPGKTLTIKDSSEISALCDTLWDGIYILGPTSHLIVKGHSRISDAKNAIVSIAGGDFQLSNYDTLRDNYKNVVVHYYNANHPGRISNTLINCDRLLLYPYHTRGTYIGIEADSVLKLFVGDSTTSLQNHFDIPNYGTAVNSTIGIYGTDSYIYAYNNLFTNFGTNVHYTTQVGLPYFGIYTNAINANTSLPLSKLRVGFTAVAGYYKTNTFQNCEYGIQTVDSKFTSIYNNIFQYTTGYNSSHNNWGDAIFNSFVANPSATTSIVKNTFTTYAQAIFVWNNTATSILCNSISLAVDPVVSGFYLRGICTAYCQNAVISSNTVTGPTGGNTDVNIEGLHVELGPGTIMGCNSTISTVGRAIIFGGNCTPGTVIYKNNMGPYWDGFYLNNGAVGTQGALLNPNDNTWNPPGTYGTDTYTYLCNGTSTFYVKGGIYHPAINTSSNGCPVIINPTTGNTTLTCTSCSSIVPANLSQGEQLAETTSSELMDIAQGTSLSNLTNENKWLTKYFAYKDVLLNNIPTTGALSSFMQTNQSSDIGLLTQVNNLIESGNYAQALTTLGSLTTTSAMAANLKSFYILYAGNLAAGNKYILTPDQNATLVTMAQQCSYTYGPAVYNARAYLRACGDYTVYQNACEVLPSTTSNAKLVNPNNTQQEVPISVYPNPAKDKLNVIASLPLHTSGEINIYDAIGNKILTLSLTEGENNMEINLSNIAAGVYFYKVNVENQTVKSDKLIIIK